jgi:hypothetical protein
MDCTLRIQVYDSFILCSLCFNRTHIGYILIRRDVEFRGVQYVKSRANKQGSKMGLGWWAVVAERPEQAHPFGNIELPSSDDERSSVDLGVITPNYFFCTTQ